MPVPVSGPVHRVISLLALVLALGCDRSSPEEKATFAPWLGPQSSDLILPEAADKLDRYSVRLRVVEAARFETPRTTNGVVTFAGGGVRAFRVPWS